MSHQLTERVIKLLCGGKSFEQGSAYVQQGKVTLTQKDADSLVYEAIVHGNSRCHVSAAIDRNGDVDASCTCPVFYTQDLYCKHIAALLLCIQASEQEGRERARSYPSLLHAGAAGSHRNSGFPSEEYGLTSDVMKLFSDRTVRASGTRRYFDARAVLDVEFTCKAFSYMSHSHMFGIELKVGPKRLFIVQKIREFLDSVSRGTPYAFSKSFVYDPEQNSFSPSNDALLRKLIEIYENEALYREKLNAHSAYAPSASKDRILLIPPHAWEELLPHLLEAPLAQLDQEGRTYQGIHTSEETIPLQFELGEAMEGGYRLHIQGLDEITVLEAYGVVLYAGKLLKLPPHSCGRLAELQRMLESSREPELRILPNQIEAFVQKVIPGLMKIGSVRIKESVSELFVQKPLVAKLYLDRVRDRLLAGLEFQYGDIAFNPLEDQTRQRGTDRILIRDDSREQRILELMEQSAFAKTESGYFLDDEEGEYEFLYHTVPQLEKLASVYATSAVKVRLHTGYAPPKVKIDTTPRTDWLEFKFDLDGIREADIRGLVQSLKEKRRYYRMPNGSLMPLESAEFQEIVRFINETGFRQDDVSATRFQLPLYHAFHLADRLGDSGAVKLGKSLRQLLDNVKNPDNLDFAVPEPLAPVLRDYQKYGFQWMKTLAHYGFGGILADDMGLGKTIQSIAFIASVLPDIRSRRQPAFIVSPASLVYNWRNEWERFAPDVRVVIVDGTREERARLLKNASQADVIITSYPLLRKDIDLYAKLSFHTLILDEAQAFKNFATQTAQSVKAIAAQHRFALTGTPVENALEELWSIFGVVFSELLPGRREFSEMTREAVARRVRPFLLRRLKSDVLTELPDKIETVHTSSLQPEQKELYAAYLAKLQQETLKHLNDRGFQQSKIRILAGITRLRQICCHPSLFIEDYAGSSAKFEQLMDIVEDCRSVGRRMLIFSQFTEMLGMIGRELGLRGVSHFYLDGQTPVAERVELCSRFNNGEKEMFLISLKAGGTGLNLTGADTVLLYDLWWNPAVEQQAADRAHRIGQKKVVQVIRLVAEGTLEEKMIQLQQRKKHLVEEVIQPGQEQLSVLTEQDIREMLLI